MGASSAEPDPPARGRDEVVAALRAAGCVFAEQEAALLLETADTGDRLEQLLRRRVAGEPLEQVLGWAEFCGLRLAVAPGVFVPRRRSKLLVDLAVPGLRPGAVVVDLCCGTGALGAAVAAVIAGIELHAADIDPDAVGCARRNLPTARVHQGDLFAALPAGLHGRVQVLLVNAPYVPTGQIAMMPTEARDHEHRVALDGGTDGLEVHRRVAAGASYWLAPGGVLLLETSAGQAPASAAACRQAGLDAEVVQRSEAVVVRGLRPISGHARGSGTMTG